MTQYQKIRESSAAGQNGGHRIDLPALRASVQGRVIAPGEPGYDESREVFYGGIDSRPAVIIRAAGPQDVVRAVELARETGLPLAVRSGGHSVAGHSTVIGGILLHLGDMRGLDLDPEGRTVWAETGLTAGDITTAAAEYGLAVPFGDTGSVGIGGLTLGGGVGYLVRKYGLTIDNLLAAELVTAGGQLLRADAGHHPDLFWAVRGGGGNFGVATRFQYRLQPADPVHGGMLVLPLTAEVLAGFMAAAEQAPEELSTIANAMPAPPMPFLPPELHGQMILLAMMVYVGPAAEAEKVMAPFRALAAPLADMLRPMKYPEMFPPEEEGYKPTAVSRTLFVERIDRAAAEGIIERLQRSDAPFRVAQLRALGGAAARVPVEATAFPHRREKIMVNLAAFFNGADERAARDAWVEEFAHLLSPDGARQYVNFVGGEGAGRVQQAYPGPAWERLRQVKAKYDPDNLFHINHNIPPAG